MVAPRVAATPAARMVAPRVASQHACTQGSGYTRSQNGCTQGSSPYRGPADHVLVSAHSAPALYNLTIVGLAAPDMDFTIGVTCVLQSWRILQTHPVWLTRHRCSVHQRQIS